MSISTSTISNRSKIKIVFLGDQNTGKTSIIERYINDQFYQNPDPTVGVDFIGKNISHNGQHFRLQLWDTAGQQRFRSLVPNYLKDATCAVFVIDLSNEQTLQQIHKWIQLFDEHRLPKSVSVLCGNKKDIAGDVNMTKVEQLLKKYPMPFIQVSARTGQSISQLFPMAIEQVIRMGKQQGNERTQKTEKTEGNEVRDEREREREVRLPEPLPTATFESNKIVLGGQEKGHGLGEQGNKKGKCCGG